MAYQQAPESAYDSLLRDYLPRARAQAGLEDADRAGGIGFMRSEFERNTGPAVSEAGVRRRFSAAASDAGRSALQAQQNARTIFGQRGVTGGGLRLGAGTDIEMARLGQLTRARTQGLIDAEIANSAAGFQRQQAAQGVGAAMMQPRSMLGLDAMGDLLGLHQGERQRASLERSGLQASRDTREGAKLGLWGGVIQGGLGLAGAPL